MIRQIKKFSVQLRNRLISTGLKPVKRLTKRSCIATWKKYRINSSFVGRVAENSLKLHAINKYLDINTSNGNYFFRKEITKPFIRNFSCCRIYSISLFICLLVCQTSSKNVQHQDWLYKCLHIAFVIDYETKNDLEKKLRKISNKYFRESFAFARQKSLQYFHLILYRIFCSLSASGSSNFERKLNLKKFWGVFCCLCDSSKKWWPIH